MHLVARAARHQALAHRVVRALRELRALFLVARVAGLGLALAKRAVLLRQGVLRRGGRGVHGLEALGLGQRARHLPGLVHRVARAAAHARRGMHAARPLHGLVLPVAGQAGLHRRRVVGHFERANQRLVAAVGVEAARTVTRFAARGLASHLEFGKGAVLGSIELADHFLMTRRTRLLSHDRCCGRSGLCDGRGCGDEEARYGQECGTGMTHMSS